MGCIHSLHVHKMVCNCVFSLFRKKFKLVSKSERFGGFVSKSTEGWKQVLNNLNFLTGVMYRNSSRKWEIG
jgi:hypothetical protein